MSFPNFLIIGAAKSGTGSLYRYLGQHPQVYMSPVKEPSFFAFEGQTIQFSGPGDHGFNDMVVTNLDEYQALFQNCTDEIAVGEASPVYLYYPNAPLRIKHYLPQIKLIAILRNPVERAYSSFSHLIRYNHESRKDFAQALSEEDKRISQNWQHLWHYKRLGLYHAQLKRYFDCFQPEQLLIYTYDEFSADTLGVVQTIFRFLGVDDTFVPDVSVRYNVTGKPRSKIWDAILTKPSRLKTLAKQLLPGPIELRIRRLVMQHVDTVKPEFPEATRWDLLNYFREDILQLQDLIQKDLSNWLQECP